MKLGFTGSRFGMSAEQKATFWKLVNKVKDELTLFTHGDCKGADVEAAEIIRDICPLLWIESRPGKVKKWRGYGPTSLEHPAKDFHDRDRDIVEASTNMIATPLDTDETVGGTWYTTNYSVKKEIPVIIIWRSGKFELRVGGLNIGPKS